MLNWTVLGHNKTIARLEKDIATGNVSHDPLNHQKMSDLRERKIELVADSIPLQKIDGEKAGDLLVISWGGTYGAVCIVLKIMNLGLLSA